MFLCIKDLVVDDVHLVCAAGRYYKMIDLQDCIEDGMDLGEAGDGCCRITGDNGILWDMTWDEAETYFDLTET